MADGSCLQEVWNSSQMYRIEHDCVTLFIYGDAIIFQNNSAPFKKRKKILQSSTNLESGPLLNFTSNSIFCLFVIGIKDLQAGHCRIGLVKFLTDPMMPGLFYKHLCN